MVTLEMLLYNAGERDCLGSGPVSVKSTFQEIQPQPNKQTSASELWFVLRATKLNKEKEQIT